MHVSFSQQAMLHSEMNRPDIQETVAFLRRPERIRTHRSASKRNRLTCRGNSDRNPCLEAEEAPT